MKLEILFGGRTRFATLEALSEAKQPITAYQIAMTKGLDPAATYRCLDELLEFRVVESETEERNQTFYKLSDGSGKFAAEFLRSLKQKTSKVDDLEIWMSPMIRSERMAKIVRLDKSDISKFSNPDQKQSVDDLLSKRTQGELSALITSSKMAFNELFEQKDNMYTLKTR
jgi:DNA-binding PadR family transcriptional regulator